MNTALVIFTNAKNYGTTLSVNGPLRTMEYQTLLYNQLHYSPVVKLGYFNYQIGGVAAQNVPSKYWNWSLNGK